MSLRKIMMLMCLVVSVILHAQKGYELGAWIGLSQYYGDLNTTLSPKKPGPAGGIIAKRNFNTRVSLKTSLNYARIGASDTQSENNFQKNRNLSFRSNIFDMTTGLEFNFFEYEHGSNDAFFTPYLVGGFSIFSYNPQAELNGKYYNLRPFGTEGQDLGDEYGRINGGFTLGGGFKWDLNRDYSINIEMTFRRLFTDYIDDVSTSYADINGIKNRRGEIAALLADRSLIPEIGLPGRQRGNSRDNDTYVFFGVGILKYFGGIECPKISEL
jgi:hypothetical protein